MLKTAAVLALPTFLAGAGLLHHPAASSIPSVPESFALEVGLAFSEAAVQAALPEGLEPALGFTGGIALYGGYEGWALSPQTTGYVWVDVVSPEDLRAPVSRYMVLGFTSEPMAVLPQPVMEIAMASYGGAAPVLHALASPSAGLAVDLAVQPELGPCLPPEQSSPGHLLTSGPDGSLSAIFVPAVAGFCRAQALSAQITTPVGHMLDGFAPERTLWAAVAKP